MEKLYGLLGRTLGHSWSKPIHEAFGCKGYQIIEREPEQLEEFFAREDLGGVNVTIPYKRDVMKFCDCIDPAAEAIGSINTIVRRDGKLHGYNTDIDGFLYMLNRAGIELTGKKVVILGSGGASLTAQAAARQENARQIVVVSRNGKDNYDNLSRHALAEVLINTTPVGMWPKVDGAPVSLQLFPKASAVADMVYNPLRTNLLLEAAKIDAEAGRLITGNADAEELAAHDIRFIRHTGGLPMLVAQAKRAEELFFGVSIPDGTTEQVLWDLRHRMENIVLIGMPGSGKTTIGKLLSELSGRPYIDIDEEISREAGRSIPEIFAAEGESGFRRLENQILSACLLKSGQVIATGGGAVLWSENRLAMKRSGRVFFIRRALEDLPKDGRPLSQTGNLEEMYRVRGPLYTGAADISVWNDKAPEETAAEIWREFSAYPGN